MSEIVLNDFGGGLDNVSPTNRMRNNASPDCANFLFNRDGSIRKRLGYIQACGTDQASKIVKIHDFVDRNGTEKKLIVLASGVVKYLDGTTLSAYTVNGDAITLPASITQVDMNTTYLGGNDVVVVTSGGIPRKIANNIATFTAQGNALAYIYDIEYVSATKIYVSDYVGHIWLSDGTTWTDLGAYSGTSTAAYSIEYVSPTSLYAAGLGVWNWNGITWTEVGTLGSVSEAAIHGMHYVETDNIYVAVNDFDNLTTPGGLYHWDGASWTEIGANGNCKSLYYIASNNIYAAFGTGDDYETIDLYLWTGSWAKVCDVAAADIYEIKYVAANRIYLCCDIGLYYWDGATCTKISATVDGACSDIYYASATAIYALFDGTDKLRIYNGTTWQDIDNNDTEMTIRDRSKIVYALSKIFYISTSEHLLKCNIDPIGKIFAGNYTISGTVTSANYNKITLTVGSTDNLYAGDYLNHASITEGVYITSKDATATAVYTSVNLAAGTYTDIVVSQAPKAWYNEIYNDLLFLGNIEYANVKYPAQVAISNTDANGGKEDFYGTAGTLNVLEFGTGEGDGITAMKSMNGRLVVWKRFSVFSLSMVNPEEPETVYRQRISDKGCWCFGSVQRIPLPQGITAAIYLNDEGFYLTDGSQCWQTPAMKRVYYAWQTSSTMAPQVTSAWDEDNDMYYVAFSTTGTTNNIVLAYSPFADAFMPIEFNNGTYKVTAFGIFNRQLYHAELSGANAYLYKDNQDYGDAGTVALVVGNAITYQWKTPLLNFKVPQFLKEFRELTAEYRVKAADGTPSATATVTIKLYKNGSSAADVTLTDVNTNATEALDNVLKRFSLKDRYVQIEITGGTARDMLELHNIVLKYKEIGVR